MEFELIDIRHCMLCILTDILRPVFECADIEASIVGLCSYNHPVTDHSFQYRQSLLSATFSTA